MSSNKKIAIEALLRQAGVEERYVEEGTPIIESVVSASSMVVNIVLGTIVGKFCEDIGCDETRALLLQIVAEREEEQLKRGAPQ